MELDDTAPTSVDAVSRRNALTAAEVPFIGARGPGRAALAVRWVGGSVHRPRLGGATERRVP